MQDIDISDDIDGRGFARSRVGGDISIRKLQVFWSVARTGSITRAARMLEVTQPTLSQQLAALEGTLGNRLFDRGGNGLELTEFGHVFLRQTENVLRAVQEMDDMVARAGQGRQQTLRIAGLPSAMRALVPGAIRAMRLTEPGLDFDTYETGPAEILEMLYARRIGVALMAAGSVGELPAGFAQVPLIEDRHVLVVPQALDLAGVADPERQLSRQDGQTLRDVIQFVFGNQNGRRLQHWFDLVLPGNRTVARVRSFELAIDMVRSGMGVCLAPSLSVAQAMGHLGGVRLYGVAAPPRQIVAILPAHCLRQEPWSQLLRELAAQAATVCLPDLADEPPFIAAASGGCNL